MDQRAVRQCKHLLAFLGPSYQVAPSVMMKSDQAGEFIASRALHLQAGFHTFQDLWQLTVSHAAWMTTCYHAKPGSEESRYKLATGEDWNVRDLMLGQLLYARGFQREKFQSNAKPAIFAGFRLDTGSTYKGAYL